MKHIRLIIQTLSFAIFNGDIMALFRGIASRKATISATPLKNICMPGLHCYSCPSAVGACPIGSLQFWLNDVSMKLRLGEKINSVGLYIVGSITLVGASVGRLFCGWVCPFGFTQDLIGKITNRNIPLPKIMRYMRYVSLFLFVIILPLFTMDVTKLAPWFCKYICPAGSLYAGVPLLLEDSSLRSAASYITILKFSLLFIFIISFFFSKRSFCKTTCPLGAFWGLFSRISIFKLKLDHDTCINCNKCSRTCPMNVDVVGNTNSSDCVLCLDCVKVCPVSCLTFESEYFNKVKVVNNNGELKIEVKKYNKELSDGA